MSKANKSKKAKRSKREREPVEFTLDVNVDFGDSYETVKVVNNQTVVMPKRLFELRERSIRLLFRSIGKAVALQPKVMRQIVPIPINVANTVAKQANKLSAGTQALSKKRKKQSK